jgi:phosphoglycolate phosphatase
MGRMAIKRQFDNIIFDLDGTLVDSFQDIYSALAAAATHLGLPAPAENPMRENMHLRLDQLVQSLYPDADWDVLMQEFRNTYDGSGYPHTQVYPGVMETLRLLHQEGCRLFVATNKRKFAADLIVSRFDRDSFIDDIKTSDCSNPPLSKKEIVERILVEKRLDPEHTVLIGDTKGDWDAAVQNGLFFIYVVYGYGNLDLISINKSKAAYITSFSQLIRILEK